MGDPLYANVSLFRFPYRGGSGGWRYDGDRVGSWILEEPVHFFDSVMWCFEGLGDPASLVAAGNARSNGGAAMADNFTTVMRWPGGQYAVITQSLAGFEHHHVMEVVGTKGSLRTWWSGAEDRTREPTFELKLKGDGADKVERLEIGASGELFELDEELRLVVGAFREGRPIVSGEDARKRILVCLEAERSLAEGREVQARLHVSSRHTPEAKRAPTGPRDRERHDMTLRSTWTLAGGLSLALLLPATAMAQDDKTITVVTWNIPFYEDGFQLWVDEFKKLHPDFEVERIDMKGTDLPTFYQTQVVAGTPPDIVNIQGGLWLEYASQGGLVDLTPYLERDQEYADRLIPEVLDNWTYEGGQYGVPLYISKTLLFLNKRMMDEAGITEAPTNFDELMAAAEKMAGG